MIRVDGVSMRFGGIRALDDVSFGVGPQELFSIIGPNGSGKSTLFNVITGVYRPTRGSVFLGEDRISGYGTQRISHVGVGRTFQSPRLFRGMTVAENAMVPALTRSHQSVLSEVLWVPTSRAVSDRARKEALRALDLVGLAALADTRVEGLSYGDQKRLEIARALAARPKVLLLDEPVAGLNAEERESVRELIVRLNSDGLPVVLIEHDMRMVMGISQRVLVLNTGARIALGDPPTVSKDPAVIRAYLGDEEVAA